MNFLQGIRLTLCSTEISWPSRQNWNSQEKGLSCGGQGYQPIGLAVWSPCYVPPGADWMSANRLNIHMQSYAAKSEVSPCFTERHLARFLPQDPRYVKGALGRVVRLGSAAFRRPGALFGHGSEAWKQGWSPHWTCQIWGEYFDHGALTCDPYPS